MRGKGKARGGVLEDLRALVADVLLFGQDDPKMLAQEALAAAGIVLGIAILLFAAKGWVLTWY